MTRSPRRFVLVDPCLTGLGSHPFHYAAHVLEAAMREGFSCHLATHRTFAAGSCPAGWQVLPAFTHTSYSKYNAFGGLDRLDQRGRGPWLPPAPWTRRHAERRREERIAAFAAEVAPAIAGLQAGDVVLLATASELEAAGLARAIGAARPPAGVGWHVQFHFPVYRGFGDDFARQDRRLDDVRRLFNAALAAAAPHELRFHATTEELAAQYGRLTAAAVHVLPYPVTPPTLRSERFPGPLRVACLGDARPEKHSDCLARIVAAVAADPALAEAVRFAVQSNPGFPANSRHRAHRAVARSLAALSRMAATGGPVELLGGPLAPDEYARQLAAADVMLLAYDQDRYRVRCSGVMLETLASGAVPIVTGGGWMARQFARPLREHAAQVSARGRSLDLRSLEARRFTATRPVVVDLERAADADRGGETCDVIAVERVGPAAGPDEPPLRVTVEAAAARPATILATESGATALFPLDTAGAPVRVRIAPACHAAAAGAAVVVRRLAVSGPVPAGAVGVVIDSPADVPAALREVVRHAAHYAATAARHAATVRDAASGAAVVRSLLS